MITLVVKKYSNNNLTEVSWCKTDYLKCYLLLFTIRIRLCISGHVFMGGIMILVLAWSVFIDIFIRRSDQIIVIPS